MTVQATREYSHAALFPKVSRPGNVEEVAATIVSLTHPYTSLSQAQEHAQRMADKIRKADKPTDEMKAAIAKTGNRELRAWRETALREVVEEGAAARRPKLNLSFMGCMED
jgi:hypothetical protein